MARDNYHLTNSHILPSLIRKFYNAKVNNKSRVTCWKWLSQRRVPSCNDLAEAVLHILEKVSSNNNLLFEEESSLMELSILELEKISVSKN